MPPCSICHPCLKFSLEKPAPTVVTKSAPTVVRKPASGVVRKFAPTVVTKSASNVVTKSTPTVVTKPAFVSAPVDINTEINNIYKKYNYSIKKFNE